MANVTLTINPTPAAATVSLVAVGYTQVGNSITVPEGTSVVFTVSHDEYATASGTYIPTVDTSVSIVLVKPSSIDANKVAEDVSELLTNSVALTDKYYDIFFNTTPLDITFQQYNDDDELVTVTIPNRAKDKICITGNGSPEGYISAVVGSFYLDVTSEELYAKATGEGPLGWVKIHGKLTWGNISGTLSDQTDLQKELDAKNDLVYNSFPYTVIGNLNVTEDGIASGFSTSNYAKLPLFSTSGSAFKFTGKFILEGTIAPSNFMIMGGNDSYTRGAFQLYYNTSNYINASCFVNNNGSSVKLNFNIPITWETNTNYYFYFEKLGNVYTFGIKKENETEYTIRTNTSIYPLYDTAQELIGCDNSFVGSIDLKQTSLSVAGNSVISGYLMGTKEIQNQINTKLNISDIINNVATTTTNQALSANMGKELQDQIDNLKAIGRYLSNWNCTTGLPETNPTTSPYAYKTGDYFYVSTVSSATPAVNYKPSGTQYVIGTASTTVESQTVIVGDYYVYDGSTWQLLQNTQRTVGFVNIAGDPYDNTNLADALNDKVTANSAITGATNCKITYDDKGLVTSSASLAASDIPDLSATYVTLAGNDAQTISGVKTFTGNPTFQGDAYGSILTIKKTTTSGGEFITFANPDGIKGHLGLDASGNPNYVNDSGTNYNLVRNSVYNTAVGSVTVPVYISSNGVATICNEMVDLTSTQTISGAKTFTGNPIFQSADIDKIISVKRATSSGSYIQFANNDGVLGYIGIDEDGNPLYLDATDNTYTNIIRNSVLNTAVGSANRPAYINADGIAAVCTYELNKTVPSNAVFTDTNDMVTQTVSTTNDEYPLLASSSARASVTADRKSIFCTGIRINPSSGMVRATTFTGNVNGNCSGSSSSCTGNAATATSATRATQDGDGNVISSTYVKVANIVNNVTSTSTTTPLSANMGRELSNRIDTLEGRGRYLSTWDCTTGLAGTTPTTLPYTYVSGDYYIVNNTNSGGTNYKPNGTTYTGVASTTVETGTVNINDTYLFDGTSWSLISSTQTQVTFASIAGQPTDNTNLASALNDKVTGNTAITGATHTKITYDSKGLVTGGSDITISDVTDITATATELNYCAGATSAIQTQLNNKQATLTSGTNIKTINNTSILGSGNISITSSRIVGTIIQVVRTDVPTGCLRCDGTEYTTGYTDFVTNYLATGKIITGTYAAWQSAYDANGGNVGFFAYDSDTGNFKVPNITEGTFLAAAVASGNYASFVYSQLKAHTHTYSGTSGGASQGHTHTYSGTSGNQSQGHTHSYTAPSSYGATTGGVGDHSHSYAYGTAGSAYSGVAGSHSHSYTAPSSTSATSGGISQGHAHSYSGTTSDTSQGHTHAYSGTTASTGGTDTYPQHIKYPFLIIISE